MEPKKTSAVLGFDPSKRVLLLWAQPQSGKTGAILHFLRLMCDSRDLPRGREVPTRGFPPPLEGIFEIEDEDVPQVLHAPDVADRQVGHVSTRFMEMNKAWYKGQETPDYDGWLNYHKLFEAWMNDDPVNRPAKVIARLLTARQWSTEASVADFGCGPNRVLASSVQNDLVTVTNFDLYSTLDDGQQWAPDMIHVVDFRDPDWDIDGKWEGNFDCVVLCMASMGPSPDPFLRAAHGALKEGGYLFFVERWFFMYSESSQQESRRFVEHCKRLGFEACDRVDWLVGQGVWKSWADMQGSDSVSGYEAKLFKKTGAFGEDSYNYKGSSLKRELFQWNQNHGSVALESN
ncbi:hypothetical protein DFJ74DRAFT_509036 [Hyaloraphidium curvatum]|nr:hypothetical protein DFJ74DRAFT_509036 [Hyaloraphidium curvatum]